MNDLTKRFSNILLAALLLLFLSLVGFLIYNSNGNSSSVEAKVTTPEEDLATSSATSDF